MNVSMQEFERLRETVEDLRKQVALLTASQGQSEEIDEDTIAMIAAAVAAYLGKRTTIKFVRKISDGADPWRTQGRLNIQAARQMPQTRGL